jgi:hypothetical protein
MCSSRLRVALVVVALVASRARRRSGRRRSPDGNLFHYNAELAAPFQENPNTIYWLKIVALVNPD